MAQALVSHIRYTVPILTEAPERMVNEWAETLKNAAEAINTKRKLLIPDATAFEHRIAGPAITSWKDVLNPAYKSQGGLEIQQIKGKRNGNLKEAFEKYNSQLDYIFEEVEGVPARRFKDLIERARTDFSKGVSRRSLRFTGSKPEGLGLAVLAPMWLTNDPTAVVKLGGAGEIFVGGPKLIVKWQLVAPFKAALTQKLTQGGCILTASEWDPNILTEVNEATNTLADTMKDPALNIASFSTGGDSHIDYILVDGVPYLDVAVSVTP